MSPGTIQDVIPKPQAILFSDNLPHQILEVPTFHQHQPILYTEFPECSVGIRYREALLGVQFDDQVDERLGDLFLFFCSPCSEVG